MGLPLRSPYSESTANDTPTVLRKWFCTLMKSKEEGMKMTVFALCTADFNTEGSSCVGAKSIGSRHRRRFVDVPGM